MVRVIRVSNRSDSSMHEVSMVQYATETGDLDAAKHWQKLSRINEDGRENDEDDFEYDN